MAEGDDDGVRNRPVALGAEFDAERVAVPAKKAGFQAWLAYQPSPSSTASRHAAATASRSPSMSITRAPTASIARRFASVTDAGT